MKITAIGIGTRGDVEPLADLGKEIISRGHEFRVASFEKFKPLIESKGVKYIHLDGDANRLMKLLVTNYKTSMDFMTGCVKLFKENPQYMKQLEEAIQGSDFVLYGMLGGFAYHICELYHIPCARIFYSPFDKTDLYSLYTEEHNSPKVAKTYNMEETGMNLLTILLVNKWRKQHGLKRWSIFSDYRKKDGENILTFYPVSPVFMPQDPHWGNHIHVTGYWYHPQESDDFIPDAELEKFLETGEKTIFIGFGKAVSPELARLQHIVLEAVKELDIRTVMQADQITEDERESCNNQIYFVGDISYHWIFERVRAVVHHGGCSTNGLGLYSGCPTLVIPLALDQLFYGRTIHELGCGPAPLYIRKELCTKDEVKAAITELTDGRYEKKAKEVSEQLKREFGAKKAADIIEGSFLQSAALQI